MDSSFFVSPIILLSTLNDNRFASRNDDILSQIDNLSACNFFTLNTFIHKGLEMITHQDLLTVCTV